MAGLHALRGGHPGTPDLLLTYILPCTAYCGFSMDNYCHKLEWLAYTHSEADTQARTNLMQCFPTLQCFLWFLGGRTLPQAGAAGLHALRGGDPGEPAAAPVAACGAMLDSAHRCRELQGVITCLPCIQHTATVCAHAVSHAPIACPVLARAPWTSNLRMRMGR